VLPSGLCGPWGVGVHPDGTLVVADHYSIVEIDPDGALHPMGTPGYTVPVNLRGLAVGDGLVHVSTDTGQVHSGDPKAQMRLRVEGLQAPAAVLPARGGLLVAESGSGRVLHLDDEDRLSVVAEGLGAPVGLAVDDTGEGYASDRARGQVVRLSDGAVIAAGLEHPEGLAAWAGALWCLEAGAGRLTRIDPTRRSTRVVVRSLPLADQLDRVSAEHATNELSGRPAPFASLTPHEDSLLVGGSGDGSILRITVGG
jgi:hypothetical protein